MNVSSLNAIRSGAGVGYETSKAALSTMLRRFTGGQHIDFSARIPLGRHGSPWDVARAIAFLLSDDAAFITGAELVVDGGMSVPM